jgi:hypothetical protein
MLYAVMTLMLAIAEPPRVIIDTDLRSDVDDAGALAVVNALADHGECELIGVVASQTGPHIVAAIDAINTWYGRGSVPIGLSPVDNQRFTDLYAPVLGNPRHFPSTQSNDTAPDSTTLYRRLLHASPDQSVKIIVIGGQTCVRLLLDSEADHEGDGSIQQTGRELIERKISGLYLMAGNFVDPNHPEHNINLDLEASQRVAEAWPTPIIYSGFEIGRHVMTGARLSGPDRNPVAKAYELAPAGGVGAIGSSASYDQTMVYYAIRGAYAGDTRLWNLSEPGTAAFPNGRTVFEPDPDGRHRHLIRAADFETAAEAIEDLMVQPPRALEERAALRIHMTVDLGSDTGQHLGTLFEGKLDGRTVIGAGFMDVYNTYSRSGRHTLQFYVRPMEPDAVPAPTALPRPSPAAGAYLFDHADELFAWTGPGSGTRRWRSGADAWEPLDGPPLWQQVGPHALVFDQSRLYCDGREVLAPPDAGAYYRPYYALGHLFLYHGLRDAALPDEGWTRLHAVSWTPGGGPVDMSRAVTLELGHPMESTFAWGQLRDEVITCTNLGGVHVFDGGAWRTVRAHEPGVSYQVYTMINWYDRLLMGHYPSGEFFEYDGETITRSKAGRRAWTVCRQARAKPRPPPCTGANCTRASGPGARCGGSTRTRAHGVGRAACSRSRRPKRTSTIRLNASASRRASF